MMLQENERWIELDDLNQMYSVSNQGEFVSHARGCRYTPKVRIKNGWHVVRLYSGRRYECRQYELKIAEEIAKQFLGTEHFIFADGDKLNCHLDNLKRTDDALESDEQWIRGYQYLYSICCDGKVHSFKGNIKQALKPTLIGGKSARFTFVKNGKRRTVYAKHLLLDIGMVNKEVSQSDI